MMAKARRAAGLIQFLDKLAGPGRGEKLLKRIETADGKALRAILAEVAASSVFAEAYKRARVLDIREEGLRPPKPEALGLPPTVATERFAEAFAAHYAPRLAERAEGFAALFATLAGQPGPPLILETGTLRLAGNWAGDGQSTFLFDHFVRDRAGVLISIDVNLDSLETARAVCSGRTQLLCNDSVMALATLAGLIARPVSLLYLDSFDLDVANPGPSAAHHAMELAAAAKLLGPGSLVAVDDYAVKGLVGGKGAIVDRYMAATDAEVLYSGYQKIWRIR